MDGAASRPQRLACGDASGRRGVAHHLGWAVAVTATATHEVVGRRRIELIEAGLPAAPVHHDGGAHELHHTAAPLDDSALAALAASVRASAVRTSAAALDELAAALPAPIQSMSLRSWPADFPTSTAVQRTVPYESRADSVMYREVLAGLARPPWSRNHRMALAATIVLGAAPTRSTA